MRFQSILLENFQAHRKLLVSLDAPITTLVGPTDAGKSAVLRALRWICLNDLSGEEFIREGAKQCVVTLTLKSGDVIKRIRGNRENTYELNGEEFKAFNTSVPDPIANLLRVNEINFQAQHDSPFWFNESAPEVSRRLNAVIDLSVIDSSLAHVSRAVRTAQERVKVTEERLEQANCELSELAPQRRRVAEFAQIKERGDKLEELKSDWTRLDTLLNFICANQNELRTWEEKAAALREVARLAKDALQLAGECDSLSGLVRRIEQSQTSATAPPDFAPVESARCAWERAVEEAGGLDNLITRIEDGRQDLVLLQETTAAKERKMQKELKGQRCPLCQSEL